MCERTLGSGVTSTTKSANDNGMRRPVTLLALSCLLAIGGCRNQSAEATPANKAGAGISVLELYQSQGCSSCPPAIKNANALADRPDVLVLTFSVTYWDYLGWKDIYGQPGFTQRQHDYANGSGRSRVYTPQMIVNGKAALVGDRPDEIRTVIARSGMIPRLKLGAVDTKSVSLLSQPLGETVDLWLVRYDSGSRNVPIRAGENAGRTIAHRNIVVELTRVGSWNGAAKRFGLPAAPEPGLSSALLAQRPSGGQLLAAVKI